MEERSRKLMTRVEFCFWLQPTNRTVAWDSVDCSSLWSHGPWSSSQCPFPSASASRLCRNTREPLYFDWVDCSMGDPEDQVISCFYHHPSHYYTKVYLIHLFAGIFFVLPCIESYQKVDLRTITLGVPPQEVINFQFSCSPIPHVRFAYIHNCAKKLT